MTGARKVPPIISITVFPSNIRVMKAITVTISIRSNLETTNVFVDISLLVKCAYTLMATKYTHDSNKNLYPKNKAKNTKKATGKSCR